MRREKIVAVLILVLAGYLVLGASAQAADSSETITVSNVTVSSYVAMSVSNNLTIGIEFGSLDPDTTNNNGTHNYDGGDATTQNTSYWIGISSDTNQNVDLCVKDNKALADLADTVTIPNSGYTWGNSTTATIDGGPQVGSSIAIGTSYDSSAINNSAAGTRIYFRFWLDLPSGQQAAVYNNTVYFKGVVTGSNC